MNLIELRRIRSAMQPIDYSVWMSLRVSDICWGGFLLLARELLVLEGKGYAVTGANRTRLSVMDTSHHWRPL